MAGIREIQRLSDAERRDRFQLAASCHPVVSGLRSRGTTVVVTVHRAATPGAEARRLGHARPDATVPRDQRGR